MLRLQAALLPPVWPSKSSNNCLERQRAAVSQLAMERDCKRSGGCAGSGVNRVRGEEEEGVREVRCR